MKTAETLLALIGDILDLAGKTAWVNGREVTRGGLRSLIIEKVAGE